MEYSPERNSSFLNGLGVLLQMPAPTHGRTSEVMPCKVVSKIKKFMIEIGRVVAKNIKVNYKLFKVSARVSRSNVLVASVNGNGEFSRLHENLAGAPVREAVESSMQEMH